MSTLPSHTTEANRIIQDLRSKNEDVRIRAGNELKDFVASTAREVSVEYFTKFSNDINKRIFELVHSPDLNDKVGGILAIDKLIDLDSGEENTTKVTRFANYLRSLLPGAEPHITILAAKALGHLATSASTLTTEFVEFEVKRALEWLQVTGDRNESRRYSAVLVLTELTINAPTLIYPYIPQMLDLLWIGLRDPKVAIRDGAADALSAILSLSQVRENSLKRQWYRKIFDEIQKGFKLSNSDAIHGSLLALRELLNQTSSFFDGRYVEVAEIVLRYKEHREQLIRKTVMLMIPDLAKFNPEQFISNYLSPSMSYLLSQLKKEKERSTAFMSIGKVAIVVGSPIAPYLDSILSNIKESLIIKGKNRTHNEVPTYQCISMLAVAVGPSLTKYMHELLDHMFAGGLTESLQKALVDLSTNIPQLLATIQERLLNMLSIILCSRPFSHPGAPSRLKQLNNSFIVKDLQLDGRDDELIILALQTLGAFDFKGLALHELVRECAIVYLDDDNPVIRKSAVLTTSKLLGQDPSCFQTNNHALQIVSDILERLLSIGISDQDPTIRQTVLMSLDKNFDHHLAQADHVRTLFMALNDEVFSIREVAMGIIGRLSTFNPAYIMPSLRKLLIKLLAELEYSGISRQREESAKLIGLLISSTPKLVEPYVESVLKVLLPKAKDPSAGVASKVLAAIGELAHVGCQDLTNYLDDLMQVIIDTLQDQSSASKREAALKTLSHLASNTGYVVEPYIKYPNLLGTLITILRTEQAHPIRRETMRVMGVLGALDPHRHKIAAISEIESSEPGDGMSNILFVGPSSDDYYPAVAIRALMKILRDPSLNIHHSAVITAVMYIFKTLGLKCVPFLHQIIPSLISMMKTCPQGMLEFYFQQLGLLVTIVRQHIRNYIPDIISLIQDHWGLSANIQTTALSLVESIAVALESEFKVYLPTLLPQMLLVFENDSTEKQQPSQRLLNALLIFGQNLEEYLHLVIPAVVKVFESPDNPVNLKRSAIQLLGQLSRTINIRDQSSRIIHPIVRSLSSPSIEIRAACMDTLARIAYQMKNEFLVYTTTIKKAMNRNQIQHSQYELIITKILANEPLPAIFNDKDDRLAEQAGDSHLEVSTKKLPVNQNQLKKAWEASQRANKDEWQEWIRRFSVELLKESPSHALRACATLASAYPTLSRELFNAAFLSCWGELYDQFQDELVRALETALTSPNIPPEILQILLNLAEFMEHDDKALPIHISTLGLYATRCHAFAKALHYKEIEFITEPLPNTIESLISINNQLQQPDSAIGVLTIADVELKESWYEKLQRWEDGLLAYEKKQLEDPNSLDATLGRMRCLHNLGEWESLFQLAHEKWGAANTEVKKAIAPLAAAAAWGMGEWDDMDDYIKMMKEESPDGAFFKAILALHRNLYPEATRFIEKTRDLLDTELTALVGESYNRAYNIVVRIQMLGELEEIIKYKQLHDNPKAQSFIRNTWVKRIKGCIKTVDVWQRILKVRSLVVSPKEDMEIWIKFANLCRKGGRLSLSYKTLNALLREGTLQDFSNLDLQNNAPQVVYACLKHLWTSGNQPRAITQMRIFTQDLVEKLGIHSLNDVNLYVENKNVDPGKLAMIQLLARCYLKIGEWQNALKDDSKEEGVLPETLRSYLAATHYDRNWYKAWHAWAFANFEVVSYNEKIHENVPTNIIIGHVVPSVQGFFRSIALSKTSSLQDTLRLLTLWFKYGYQQDVNMAISEGFTTVSIDTWLEVIPQLIARIHAPSPVVRRLIHQLLADVGKEHPQALVYSLTVASKSQSLSRKKSALAILDKMRMHSANLVVQALLVSQELIRVAILWQEMWHEGLEEASKLYFTDQNIEGMYATLEPLHQMLERGPETLREVSFNQTYGRDLADALDWCRNYQRTGNIDDLNQAWDLYYQVFRRIQKQLPQLTTLELQYVSPKLLAVRDLDLAMPGTYKSGAEVIKIQSFVPTLSVMTSKQRPRRLNIKGSDGVEYKFLLKGHEDLRQDERVMQLFGLVNTLLNNDPETFKRHLNIHGYPVIPLSPNSGLIGWVPDCDTLHNLIRDYRESRRILLNIEHRLMLQMAPDYDNLTLLQKVEVFEYALENTTGRDLYKVLWLKSKNSEVWLDRRTNYTRSLASMSMVGYILGLGDRHPSNLMVNRFTGKVIHIDFGDCFEVAMHRDKFPERIPFRLTRMLINAMEISGIEGNFRITCENVMRVLRENKDSLMAVLEAFVHDPLINWRLFSSQNVSPRQDNRGSRSVKLDSDMIAEVHKGRKQRNENEIIPGGKHC
ncbi:phosphatidylinositol kinase- protein kinase tor1 [Boothiomyces sp. JEL0838]|nr:phosphatidylinositol kinase- protein kinase tor1 [Boothiomyces sp. JEL0838]